MKNWRLWLEILGAVLGLVLVASYVSAREDRVKMEATQKAQDAYQKQLVALQADYEKKLSDRQVQYQKDSDDLKRQFQGTTQQILALVSQRANLPVPLTITTPPPTAQNPNPMPQIIIPQADMPQAKVYVQECEQCKLDVAKLQADAETRVKMMQAAQQQIDSLKVERDSAVKAAKGGSWMRRVVHNGKVAAIGGGVAVIVVCALGHCK